MLLEMEQQSDLGGQCNSHFDPTSSSGNITSTNRLGQPQVDALAEIEAFERLLSANLLSK
jgi:hypothetical protein